MSTEMTYSSNHRDFSFRANHVPYVPFCDVSLSRKAIGSIFPQSPDPGDGLSSKWKVELLFDALRHIALVSRRVFTMTGPRRSEDWSSALDSTQAWHTAPYRVDRFSTLRENGGAVLLVMRCAPLPRSEAASRPHCRVRESWSRMAAA